MPRKIVPANLDHLIRDYLAGKSELQLSKELGYSRPVIKRILTEASIRRRNVAEGNRISMANRSPEERQRSTAAAHAAVHGRKVSIEERCARAATREAKGIGIMPIEQVLDEWLQSRGLVMTPQCAVGPYNADLAKFPVAVELFGGAWHRGGRHVMRLPKRLDYFLNRSWNMIVVWHGAGRYRLQVEAADYIVAFYEKASGDPSFRSQYRMIRGDGQEITVCGLNLYDFARVKAAHCRKNLAATDNYASG